MSTSTSVSNAFTDLFYGNPFNTHVGSLVEEATESFVAAELWQLFTQVCDAINNSPNGPKEAVRAIRRRFVNAACSNETVALHSLLLLETCVLNCGYRFYVVLAVRDNLRDITKFAAPDSTGIPECVRNKLLLLIQDWALKFNNQVDLQEFVHVYTELKESGVSFSQLPPTSSATVKPVQVPSERSSHPVQAPLQPNSALLDQASTTAVENTTPQHVSPQPTGRKLDADLAQVRVNICVLSDLITESETVSLPNDEVKQLMAEIVQSLQEMAKRLIQAISSWEAYQEQLPHRGTSDSVLMDMINVNDELHTVLLRYGRTVRSEDRTATQIPDTAQNATEGATSASNMDNGTEVSAFVGEPAFPSATSVPETDGSTTDTVPLMAPPTVTNESASTKDVKLIDF